jgi:biotin carboxylase
LRWNDAQTLARFFRKSALKDHLRRAVPSLRLNFSCRVTSAAEVVALGDSLPPTFILKPDSGFGSRGVAVFTREMRAEVEKFFARTPDACVLEEFLHGPLYAVDGLVDAEGEVLVGSIFSSGRRHLNGCPVVYANGALIHHDTPLFDELGAYAREVLRAVGLRRSPFHMEVVRDARGPCLIEVGARLVGHSHAFTCERVHGGAFDFFGLAAAGYFGKPMDLRLSFEHYDRLQAVKVYGASEVEGTAYEVRGLEEVEALPSFDRWIVKPRPGVELRRTVDLFSVPYSLVLVGPRRGEPLGVVGERVHEMIRFETGGSILGRARVGGEALADKMRRKLGWMAEQARRTLMHATGQR